MRAVIAGLALFLIVLSPVTAQEFKDIIGEESDGVLSQPRALIANPAPIQMIVGSDVEWAVGLQLELHLNSPAANLNDALPLLRVPAGWFIKMNREPKNVAPALIQVGDGKNCLIGYNEICLIRGTRLDVR